MRKNLFLSLCLIAGNGWGNLFFTPAMIESHLVSYTTEEKGAIEKDLQVVRSVCQMDELTSPNGKPTYLATAGMIGARKSTILERFLSAHQEYSNSAYIDPDQRTLKFMVHTYYTRSLNSLECAKEVDHTIVRRQAYDKWRGGSNYIAVSLLEEAFARRLNITHGATCTGPHIPAFLQTLRDANYNIVLLLCACDTGVAEKAVEYRNDTQGFCQSDPSDVGPKAKFFPQRMSAYFNYADVLYCYWSDDLFTPERLAAVFDNETLEVVDEQALLQFVSKYENDRIQLASEGISIPSWPEIVRLYTNRR